MLGFSETSNNVDLNLICLPTHFSNLLSNAEEEILTSNSNMRIQLNKNYFKTNQLSPFSLSYVISLQLWNEQY